MGHLLKINSIFGFPTLENTRGRQTLFFLGPSCGSREAKTPPRTPQVVHHTTLLIQVIHTRRRSRPGGAISIGGISLQSDQKIDGYGRMKSISRVLTAR